MRLTQAAAASLLALLGSPAPSAVDAYSATAPPPPAALLSGGRPSLSAAFVRPPPATRTMPRPALAPAAAAASRWVCQPASALYAAPPGGEVESNDENEEEEGEKPPADNPYADPNYPDLEFVNYDDPEYAVDQGIAGDEFFPSAEEEEALSSALSEEEAEVKVEEFREDRRRRNDEYQFETYHAEMLRSGELFRGEWEVYRTSTFLPGREDSERVDANGMPRLVKARRVLRMVSSGSKVKCDTDSQRRVDGERLVHEERESTAKFDGDDDEEEAKGDEEFEAEIMSNKYWPDLLGPYDFRGEQGIMCVGNAYTICRAVPLGGGAGAATGEEEANGDDGPFSELRAEVGLQYKRMRFRVKFDYRVNTDDDGDATNDSGTAGIPPPLCLRSMTVCREARERWPRYGPGRTDVDDAATAALFGPPGAYGGLYDPPPVGSDEQATRYMMVDLEGGATVLFPHTIDQDPESFGGNGWVTSLDWSPGRIRYQVDRKVLGGTKVKGLKTLELSEVQGEDVDWLRPRDGGADMRQ